MTNEQWYKNLAAEQALKISQLEADNARLTENARQIKLELVCIGGPLNDNKLRYTREQLVPLARIAELADCS